MRQGNLDGAAVIEVGSFQSLWLCVASIEVNELVPGFGHLCCITLALHFCFIAIAAD